ncbi:unnamed protein product [Adineta steineri]|uniref:Tetraspanin n=1 Tax=Adineta steineri TaxID=433720 RepID=A0A813MCA3_9BILA|nr:unnamed protein product [Adineta steineri]CAF0727439.1 unnamed protein product [Adineta steineri]CAF0754391.1 unnamed protein product [Adineta steineri]CAF3493446.1 unnamed protein product [Adineta steineri]CAF3595347.1 unnamed protein product [Adineta steineri]
MGIGNCHPCAKYLLLVLNLIFWLSGAALIVLGVLFFTRPEVQPIVRLFNLTSIPLSSIEITAFFIILFGIIIFFVGLFGLCGAIRESRTCLILYIVLVTTILLAELALFTYIAISYEQWHTVIKQRLVSQTKKYNYEHPSQYERAVDYVQSKYHCCGIDSAYDYSDSRVPVSCCSITNSTSCTINQVSSSGVPGCFRLLTQGTIYWGKFFIIFELSLCLLSLIGIFLAICVCQHAMLYDGYIQAPYRI